MTDLLMEFANRSGMHPKQVLRMLLASQFLMGMMSIKMEDKEAKVRAAFEYADLVMKG